MEDPGGVRRGASLRVRAGPARRGRPACASITSTACSRPATTCGGCRSACCGGRGAGDDRSSSSSRRFSAPASSCRADWPVHGTTGYEFAAVVNNLFVDRRNERALDDIYRRFVRERRERLSFADLAYRSKKQVHARNDVGRHQLARPSAQSLLRAQPPLPRLHALQPDLHAQGSDRLLPGLPHLRHRRPTRSATTTAATSSRRCAARSAARRRSPASSSISSSGCCSSRRPRRRRDDAKRGRGSSASFSRSPARSPRRASRTRRSTSTTACCR